MVRQISQLKKTSIRRTSRVLGVRRSSLYYIHNRKNEDKEIVDLLHLKSMEQPNWGSPMGRFLLLFHWCGTPPGRNQGKKWNKNRAGGVPLYRVYKAEKLNLRKPKTRKKIKRVAINRGGEPSTTRRANKSRMVNGFST